MQCKPADSKEKILHFFTEFQDALTLRLEGLDGGATFKEDCWCKSELGYGKTQIGRAHV